ncbi:MAG: DEAD/DEAH box helicase family protein, partial [Nitrospinota bacterium]
MVTLRPYQTDCLQAITGAWRDGVNRLLVSLPTGTGKTVVFAHLPQALGLNRKMLVLAHREELLEQAREKIVAANPEARVEIEQAERKADPGADIIIASVPSIGRNRSKRIEKFDPADFGLLICDEAHHAVAPTYRNVFDHFGLSNGRERPRNQDLLLVGFTATPRRGDHVGLEEVFDEIVYHRSIKEMIRQGYLAPITGYR